MVLLCIESSFKSSTYPSYSRIYHWEHDRVFVIKSLNLGVRRLGFKVLYGRTIGKAFNSSKFSHLKNEGNSTSRRELLSVLNEVICGGTFYSI